jgi:hypothetical protein
MGRPVEEYVQGDLPQERLCYSQVPSCPYGTEER